MTWFYNMKMKGKLLLSFSIITLFMIGIGILGLQSLSKVREIEINIAEEQLPSINYLLTIKQSQTEIDSAEWALYSTTLDMDSRKSEYNKISNSFEKVQMAMDGYQKLTHNSEEKIAWNNFIVEWDKWREQDKIYIDLCKKYDLNPSKEVFTQIDNVEVDPSESQKLLQQIVDKNDSISKNANQQATKTYTNARTLLITSLLIACIVIVIICVCISNMISNSIKKLTKVADEISNGNFQVDVDIYSKDEIGLLAESFRKILNSLNNILSDINVTSTQVSSGARQVSNSAQVLSNGATEQASAIEQLTASIEKISVQTEQNAKKATDASKLAFSAKDDAVEGNNQMENMINAMNQINEASTNIFQIIKVIDDIAFQTNILALNAAVEAARAGQYGKGFAVVANEVRNLAARSANAAKETTILIENSIKKTEDGRLIANDTALALNKIVQIVSEVTDIVNSISTASNEQASGISQINIGIIQVSDVVQTNSSTSEESASASEELSGQAEILKKLVSQFNLKI